MLYVNHKKERIERCVIPWDSWEVSVSISFMRILSYKASLSTYFVLSCCRWWLADLVYMKVRLHMPNGKFTFWHGESHAKNIFCLDALSYDINSLGTSQRNPLSPSRCFFPLRKLNREFNLYIQINLVSRWKGEFSI